ncbi:branched-chain amino acid ABC transporter permease [Rhodovulum sp. DZ06]|uniref:branched-chain amino acid ABC transporter permease n=1 Tax=Rhodovulum sp. DZ06 TaxID=3425126 RepID=UPI003D34FE99
MTRPAAASSGLFRAAMPWIIAAIFLVVAPLIFSSNSDITIMNQMAITIVFALAYNMLLGQGGMLSFGHAVYMGMGGFFSMHVINYLEVYDVTLPLPVLPLLGGLFGMFFATVIGAFSTRNAGTVFAMISLGIGELVAACSIIITAFFGGEEGVSGDRTWNTSFFGIEWLQQIEVYYLIAAWTFIAALGMFLFSRTPLGRMANAVRDNAERAEFLGYSARWVRYGSFVASGFFAGVAGALFAINYEILTEENLNLATSGSILLVTFLGGVGFFAGPIVGAILFTLLQTVMSLHTEVWALYLGALFVAVVMFAPQGLTGIIAMHSLPWKLGKMNLLVKPYITTVLPGIIAVLAGCGLIELLFHVEHASADHPMIGIYGVEWNAFSVVSWAVFGAVFAACVWLARRGAPDLVHAWHQANTLPDSKLGGGA